jgi:anti-sigma factor RsiW
MTCEQARQLLHGYIDDELDLATALQMQQHLEDCARCRQELESAQAIRAAVALPGLYQRAPVTLGAQLQKAIRAESQAMQKGKSHDVPQGNPVSPRSFLPRWNRLMTMTALAAALLVAATVIYWPERAPRASQAEIADVLSAHLRSLEADHLFDVASTDQHTVKPWFDGKVEFAPPVVDLASDGFPLVGGRLDYLQGQKVAALVYRRDKHIINLFIWPGNAAPETDIVNGYNLIQFQCNGMICWAVSDLNPAELQRFVDLFKAQNPAATKC